MISEILKLNSRQKSKSKMKEKYDEYVKYAKDTGHMKEMFQEKSIYQQIHIHKNSSKVLHSIFRNEMMQEQKKKDLRDRLKKKLEERR